MITYDDSHDESHVLAAGFKFVDDVYAFGKGLALGSDDAFTTAATLYVEAVYVSPRRGPSRVLAVWLADGKYVDALYLLAKADLLPLDVLQRTAALVETAIENGDRDPRDMRTFSSLLSGS